MVQKLLVRVWKGCVLLLPLDGCEFGVEVLKKAFVGERGHSERGEHCPLDKGLTDPF